MLGLRIEPTTTTGFSLRTVRSRKYARLFERIRAAGDDDARESASSVNSVLMRLASSIHCLSVSEPLATLANCSNSGRTYRSSPGIDADELFGRQPAAAAVGDRSAGRDQAHARQRRGRGWRGAGLGVGRVGFGRRLRRDCTRANPGPANTVRISVAPATDARMRQL